MTVFLKFNLEMKIINKGQKKLFEILKVKQK